jgi:hypothetical protein
MGGGTAADSRPRTNLSIEVVASALLRSGTLPCHGTARWHRKGSGRHEREFKGIGSTIITIIRMCKSRSSRKTEWQAQTKWEIRVMEPNPASSTASWREFYRAAILELDPSKLPQRILEAEMSLIARAREIFQMQWSIPLPHCPACDPQPSAEIKPNLA